MEKLYGILWPLMKLPPSQRRKEVRREPQDDPRLADLLLKESEKVLAHGVVEAADDRARTAEWIAGVLPADD